jgi:hypothetical protein
VLPGTNALGTNWKKTDTGRVFTTGQRRKWIDGMPNWRFPKVGWDKGFGFQDTPNWYNEYAEYG